MREVKCNSGPFRDHSQRVAQALLKDIVAGRPLLRSDAVAMARIVLESRLVRAAEAVLDADDASLCARLAELLRLVLDPSIVRTTLPGDRGASQT